MSARESTISFVSLGPETPEERVGATGGVRLDSWKEIAAYLKRDTRTVQLWEKKEGLPVHRHTHTARVSVYAYVSEIDAWQKRRRPQPGSLSVAAQAAVETGKTPSPLWQSGGRSSAVYITAAVLILCTLAAVGYRRHRHLRKKREDDQPTIAILPFDDLSDSHAKSYLADGLTEELITELGRTGRMQVISRTAISRFKGNPAPLSDVAQELHANLIVEGTVTSFGKRARITAQLIDAATDRQLWANSYEGDFENVLVFEDAIASQVAQSVVQKVSSISSAGATSSDSAN